MDKGFDYRWKRHPKPQATTENIFWQKTGWDADDLEGTTVLDAGCGCGRFTAIAAKYAKRVIAIDASPHALAAAKENAPTAEVREDNLLDICSVPAESVDLAFALGTLQHTGDTKKALLEVARTVKLGGQLAVWVYCKPAADPTTLKAINMLHEITRNVPPEILYDICERYSVLLRDAYNGAWGPLQQVLRISNSMDDDECVSDTFDWHCPQHRDWHTNEEVARWFDEAGFEVDLIGEFPVSVRGTRIRSAARKRPRKDCVSDDTKNIRAPKKKRSALCISDVKGWAFDQNMHDLEEYLSDRFNIEHAYVFDWLSGRLQVPSMDAFDVVYCLYHKWGIETWLPWDRTVGSLRAQWMFPENKRPPQFEEFRIVNQYKRYHVVTQSLFDQYKADCPNLYYLTNPVNTRRFAEEIQVCDKLVASWNGNAQHQNANDPDVKGFYTILRPACKKADVKLEFAEYATCRLKPAEMPPFYRKANVCLCASLYEGASNSVMEAMAAGQAAILTDCGNHREMYEEQLKATGESGIILVERDKEAFIEALEALKADVPRALHMGQLNRAAIQRAWSWDVWSDRYAEFLSL